MPFCDVMEVFEYWEDYPPVHKMIRDYLGYEKKPEMDMQTAMTVLNPTSRGKTAKVSRAPDRIKRMAESVRKAAEEIAHGR